MSGEAGFAPGAAHYASKKYRGFGYVVDKDEGEHWARLAIDSGDPYTYGLSLYRGLGIHSTPDEAQALHQYRICGANGFAAAQFICGVNA